MALCDPWDQAYREGHPMCGSFMDVWGPYIWIGLAVIALIVLASVLRQRRAPLHDDRPTEPQKPQATRSGDDPLSREQVAILAVVVAVIIIVVVIAATF